MSSTLDKISEVALEEFVKQNPNRVIDPAWVTLIVDIINQVLAAFQACKKTPAEVTSMVNNPSLIQKLVLHRTLVNTLGRREMREHGEDLKAALLATGRRLELSDVEELLDS